ncbi:hypothetical protein ACFVZH_20780 [Streptomyces sp. NPDC059534]|uniref:hypothetical protein n=1 Tax=Streptomyces sp. NPDC059534 TaxID=3346859 RepID=UPI0036AAFBFB
MSDDRSKPIWAKIRTVQGKWDDFGDAAESMHSSGRPPRSRVIKEFMDWYMRQPGAKLPERPPAGPWSKLRAVEEGEVE